MAQLTRTELNTNADTRQPDNIVGAIDATDTRQQDKDLADSAYILDSNSTDDQTEGTTNLFVQGSGERSKIGNLPLDTNQEIADLNSAIIALEGSLIPQGNWDASTNTPDISGTTETGYYWIVSVDGSTNLDGITDWKVNDWAIKTDTGWAKVDNTDAVLSVNGSTGVVVLDLDNIADTADRKALTIVAQTIEGRKTFNEEAIFESGIIAARPSITQAGSFTVSATQQNRLVLLNVAGATTITIDDSSATAFSTDDEMDLFWLADSGSNTVTFATGGSQSIASDGDLLDIANVKAAVSIKYIGSNQWVLIGKLA